LGFVCFYFLLLEMELMEWGEGWGFRFWLLKV
jgi:hypothetical protein